MPTFQELIAAGEMVQTGTDKHGNPEYQTRQAAQFGSRFQPSTLAQGRSNACVVAEGVQAARFLARSTHVSDPNFEWAWN